jgi:hypothetical protein
MGLCKVSGRVDRILFTIFLVLVAQSAIWQYNSPGLQLVDAAGGGTWEVVVENAGIASMHTAVTHFGNVVLLDRTNIGPSLLPLPKGICRDNHLDQVIKLSLNLPSRISFYSSVPRILRTLHTQQEPPMINHTICSIIVLVLVPGHV